MGLCPRAEQSIATANIAASIDFSKIKVPLFL
jgi:hypothetical protein